MNLKNKKILLVGFLLFFIKPNVIFAQQDAQYTNYMYNTSVVNPAYTGTREVFSIFGLHRTQWVGFEGAPTTNNFSLHTPINNSNLGIGVSFINDQIGPANENTFSTDIAYRINTSRSTTLSFGLKLSANLLNVDFSKLTIQDPTDVEFKENIDNRI